jgi:hypothetical protein
LFNIFKKDNKGAQKCFVSKNGKNILISFKHGDIVNKNAEILQVHKENTPENREFFAKKVEEALGIVPNTLKITAIKDFYWPIGTHYYEPLDHVKYRSRPEFIREAQHPEPGMLVVGEDVSRRQGWTEGALESVANVLNKSWIDTYNC